MGVAVDEEGHPIIEITGPRYVGPPEADPSRWALPGWADPTEWSLPSFAKKTPWLLVGALAAAGAYYFTGAPAPRRRRR